MPSTEMETSQHVRYHHIRSHDSIVPPSNGYVCYEYVPKAVDFRPKQEEDAPIDFSLKSTSTKPELPSNPEHPRSSSSVLEQHLRNGYSKFNSEQTPLDSKVNGHLSDHARKMYYESEPFVDRRLTPKHNDSFQSRTADVISYPGHARKSNDNFAVHNSHSPAMDHQSEIIRKSSDELVTLNRSPPAVDHHRLAPVPDSPQVRYQPSPNHANTYLMEHSVSRTNDAFKREEYHSEADFKTSSKRPDPEKSPEQKNTNFGPIANSESKHENGECSVFNPSSLQSVYSRKEGADFTRFQPLSANPFVPSVFNGMGIMNPSSNFAHLGHMGYPSVVNNFAHFMNGNPIVHPAKLGALPPMKYDRKHDKNERPFKQLANELIFGVPAMIPVDVEAAGYGAAATEATSTVSVRRRKSTRSPSGERSSPVPQMTPSDDSASPKCTEGSKEPQNDEKGPGDSNSSFSDATANSQQQADTSCGKRRSLPDHMKNDIYWAKRRKNNAAAKRSRDARRKKEDMLAITAKTLRDQNYQLQIMLAAMQEQITLHTAENKRLSDKCNSQEIQIFRMKEDHTLNQKLCRRCNGRLIDNDMAGNGL